MYSTVAKPWLKVRAASTFFSSASGIGSPVRQWTAKRSSISGCSSQCSKSCEGNSTKSRETLVPAMLRVGHVREEAVQRVAELVEQRARVVEAEQRRLALGGLGEVHHVDDDRADVAGELLLAAEAAHPGAAPLGGAGEIVAEEEADMAAFASVTSQARTSG